MIIRNVEKADNPLTQKATNISELCRFLQILNLKLAEGEIIFL